MKKVIVVLIALLIVIGLLSGVFWGVISGSGILSIDYERDDMLFATSGKSNTTTYLCYNSKGELVEAGVESGGPTRQRVSLGEVNEYLILAAISAEDREFYRHKGINIGRTFLALFNSIFHFRSDFGASTITQQVIKNISGDNDRTVKRKISEIARAIHLERNHTKDEILELYLNILPMAGNVYGVKAAAYDLFNKDTQSLTLAECALLVGITNAPSRYDPRRFPTEALEKRNAVLYAMLDNGAISEEEYKKARIEPISVVDNTHRPESSTSWFIETARDEILDDISQAYSVSSSAARLILASGTKVILTMNPEIQAIAEEKLGGLPLTDGEQYAVAIYSSDTGDLVGIVGQAGPKSGYRLLNYAKAKHPPASTLKPLALYTPSIERGEITISSLLSDAPVDEFSTNDSYYPKNSPNVYDGLITAESALARSKNTTAVRLYSALGADFIFDLLSDRFGFHLISGEKRDGRILSDKGPSSLALGQLTDGISLCELTHAYTVFPKDGILTGGRSYYGVFDEEGGVVISKAVKDDRIFSESASRVMSMMLSAVGEYGTARSIRLKEIVDTAIKTGTSGGARDRLVVGYTPYFTVGLWTNRTNFDSGESHIGIWDDLMITIHNSDEIVTDKEYKAFSAEGLEIYEYCTESGALANDACRLEGCSRYGYYISGTSPKEYCDRHFPE